MQSAGFSIPKDNNVNGDRFVVQEISPSIFLFAIADGVGSTSQPGYAAECAINQVVQAVTLNPQISFNELFSLIKNKLDSEANSVEPTLTLQTTLTVCIVDNQLARVGHVGDTRLYHLRNNGLMTRTEDQTEIKKLIDDGVISPIRAKKYPRKNVLLSVLASNRDFTLYENQFSTTGGDRLILASDGFYKLIAKQKIVELSNVSVSATDLSKNLNDFALTNNLSDDCTCLVVEL